MNGKERRVNNGATVADLVATLGLSVRNVVVELNGEPVARDLFIAVALTQGDVLEIVRAVQGG